MNIILTAIGVLIFDWTLAYVLTYNKKKNQKRDEDLFIFKLENILESPNSTHTEKIEKAKELCRRTKGKIASGAYIALDCLEKESK